MFIILFNDICNKNLGGRDTESSKCREFHYAQSGQPVNDSQNVSSYHRGSTTKKYCLLSLPLQMAECLVQAHPDSLASQITARLISINVSNA